ncbi:hypothetical protein Tco_0114233 [Tanacetum coccineum]
MEIEEQNGTKRNGPALLTLDWDEILASIKNPKVSSEDLELVIKSERELSETIARIKNNLKFCGKLRGEKLRANLKRHEDELEKRRDLQLANKVDNECKEMIQVSDSDDISFLAVI